MNTEAGFIQALREDPQDDDTRLIFADWLEEQGDPRGEFFRVQQELANGVPDLDRRRRLHARSRELLDAHGSQWLGPLRSLCESIFWRKGQPYVTLSARSLIRSSVLKQAPALFERSLVAEVRVIHLAQSMMDNFVESPIFQYLPHLVLNGLNLGDGGFYRLLRNPHFRGFRALSLVGNRLTDGSVTRLLASPAGENLVLLDLRNNQLHDPSMWALTTWEGQDRLRDLALQGNPLGPVGWDGYTAWRASRLARSQGPRRLVNSVGMELVWIGPGTFLLGSPDDEPERYDDEGPQRPVTLSRGFYLGAFQVTQAEYQWVVGNNPARFSPSNLGGLNHPVEMVSWEEAQRFCERLTQLSGEAQAGRRYRLPTEAEWEYAARCGWDHAALPEGRIVNSDMANYGGEVNHTVPVGSYPPTPWGIYDQSGNLWDWCADWYGAYPEVDDESGIDPTGPLTGNQRVLRGGSWYGPARNCRCACRGSDSPTTHDHYYGFRVVMEIQ